MNIRLNYYEIRELSVGIQVNVMSKFIDFLVLIIFPLNIHSSISEKIYPVEMVKPKSVVSSTLFKIFQCNYGHVCIG